MQKNLPKNLPKIKVGGMRFGRKKSSRRREITNPEQEVQELRLQLEMLTVTSQANKNLLMEQVKENEILNIQRQDLEYELDQITDKGSVGGLQEVVRKLRAEKEELFAELQQQRALNHEADVTTRTLQAKLQELSGGTTPESLRAFQDFDGRLGTSAMIADMLAEMNPDEMLALIGSQQKEIAMLESGVVNLPAGSASADLRRLAKLQEETQQMLSDVCAVAEASKTDVGDVHLELAQMRQAYDKRVDELDQIRNGGPDKALQTEVEQLRKQVAASRAKGPCVPRGTSNRFRKQVELAHEEMDSLYSDAAKELEQEIRQFRTLWGST